MAEMMVKKEGNGKGTVAPTMGHPLSWLRDEIEAMFDRCLSRWPAPFEPGRGLEHFWGLDVEDAEKEVIIRAEAPGFEPGEFDIRVSDHILKIKAERKAEEEEKKEGSRAWQRYHGKFERLIALPEGVAADKAEARYCNGILEVHVPKTAAAQAKHIPVQA
jgi:HSP20 family protein